MSSEKEPGFQVLIPYKDLCKLLDASKRLEEVEKQLSHQNRMIGALRGQLYEVVEKIKSK